MTSRLLKISFGGRHHALVEKVRELTWEQFGAWLVKMPPESDDKESRGWYSGALFSDNYRHSDNFISRDLLTFDFDHVDENAYDALAYLFRNTAHALYTTWSHKAEGKGDRFRLVVPLTRPVSYDEFQAISRKVGERIGIEMVAGESHVPCQFMYQPLRRPGAEFRGDLNSTSPVLDADIVLAQYADWTDRASWPRRATGDNVGDPGTISSPLDKPGIIGAFCRAFSIEAAIEKFELPYKRVR